MNRIEKKFKELKKVKRKAFIAFITAGDPNLKTTPLLIRALEEAGVDILELGIPFSDPMADGPVIQRSSERSLKSGTTLRGILRMVRTVRKKSQLPILFMGYFNPVLQYGVERFFREANNAGVDGVLLVDLPPEEGEEVRRAAKKNAVSLVFLLAPTSDPNRIKRVARNGSGFLYYVSLTGITGAKLSKHLQSQSALKNLKKSTKLPICIGFGIKDPRQAREVAAQGDGVVVGSALVRVLERFKGRHAIPALKEFAAHLAQAVHRV